MFNFRTLYYGQHAELESGDVVYAVGFVNFSKAHASMVSASVTVKHDGVVSERGHYQGVESGSTYICEWEGEEVLVLREVDSITTRKDYAFQWEPLTCP